MKKRVRSILPWSRLLLGLGITMLVALPAEVICQEEDAEYQALIERIMKASHRTRDLIIDSLINLPEPNFPLMDRMFLSEEFRKTHDLEYDERLWRQKFDSTYSDNKRAIIDSMITEGDVNCELTSDILLTNKYRGRFFSFGEFASFRTWLYMKIGTGRRQYCGDARFNYCNAGERSRYFSRQSWYKVGFARQKRLAELRDLNGTLWAAFYTDWFPKCRNSVWLMKKESGSSVWRGPWFTGVYGPDSARDPQASLKIMGNSLYLRCSPDSSYYLIDEAHLTKDTDRDRLYDIEEIEFGTDPRNRDTDGDGISDSEDINPLAAGIEFPEYRDMAMRMIVRILAINDEPINIYVISGDINSEMEFFSDSPDAIFLPDMKYREYSNYDLSYKGSVPISLNVLSESDSLLAISAVTVDSTTNFYFGKHRRRWSMDSVAVVSYPTSMDLPDSSAENPDNR